LLEINRKQSSGLFNWEWGSNGAALASKEKKKAKLVSKLLTKQLLAVDI
jgi:hypothetical protein